MIYSLKLGYICLKTGHLYRCLGAKYHENQTILEIIWSQFYVTIKLEALTDSPRQTSTEKYTKDSHSLLNRTKTFLRQNHITVRLVTPITVKQNSSKCYSTKHHNYESYTVSEHFQHLIFTRDVAWTSLYTKHSYQHLLWGWACGDNFTANTA